MDLSLLAHGMLLGLSVAAPVGPIGLLCIRRTLADGRAAGFVSGLGAATADLLYGCVAAFGLTVVTSALTGNVFWLRIVGGLFMLYLGIQTFRAVPATRAAESSAQGLIGAYLSTLLLTVTNPLTILAFAAMFAALGAGSVAGDYGAAMLVAAGVFLGSACWWLLLSGGVSLLRTRMSERWMQLINSASGIMIVIFGILALASVVVQ
ncbi:MAG: LysE family transporter [Roseiflexaceae bacterium]|nr:LysE family transporter [Roseiflexaceae bacterium]